MFKLPPETTEATMAPPRKKVTRSNSLPSLQQRSLMEAGESPSSSSVPSGGAITVGSEVEFNDSDEWRRGRVKALAPAWKVEGYTNVRNHEEWSPNLVTRLAGQYQRADNAPPERWAKGDVVERAGFEGMRFKVERVFAVEMATVAVTHCDQNPASDHKDVQIEVPLLNLCAPPVVKRLSSYTMTHFSTTGAPKASEYVSAYRGGEDHGSEIVITNHGMGSGIYGMTGMSPQAIAKNEEQYGSKAYTIPMANPLHLQERRHGEAYTELSKGLQRLAQGIRIACTLKHKPDPPPLATLLEGVEAKEAEIAKLAGTLGRVLDRVGRAEEPEGLAGCIARALTDFFTAYMAEERVEQPINFLMRGLGYDGVFADPEDTTDNSFSRGSVAFNVPPGTHREVGVERLGLRRRRLRRGNPPPGFCRIWPARCAGPGTDGPG